MTADRLTLSVPQAVITAAKIRAIQDGTSLSAVVAAWLEAWGAGTHPAIVPATTASNERALLEGNRAQVHRIAEQDALLARLRAQARQWRAGGPESGTHGARALTELAALSLQDDAALADSPSLPAHEHSKDGPQDCRKCQILRKYAPPAPAEPGYHGEGALADFDPGSGRSSQDDWGTE